MSNKTIATVYFYVISAAATALLVVGVFNTVNFIINSTQYDKYPLRYPQVRCDSPFGYGPYPATQGSLVPASPSAMEEEQRKQNCLDQEAEDRKKQKIEDMKNSITFTLVGLVLFGVHFPLARKHS